MKCDRCDGEVEKVRDDPEIWYCEKCNHQFGPYAGVRVNLTGQQNAMVVAQRKAESIAKPQTPLDMAAMEIERQGRIVERSHRHTPKYNRDGVRRVGIPCDKQIGKYDVTYAEGKTFVREHEDGLAIDKAPTMLGCPPDFDGVVHNLAPEVPPGCEEIDRLMRETGAIKAAESPRVIDVTVHRVDGVTAHEVRNAGPWHPLMGKDDHKRIFPWYVRLWRWLKGGA